MILSRSTMLLRQSVRLLQYSRGIVRCSSNILRMTRTLNYPACRVYSTGDASPSYRNMMGQDLEEEPVLNSLPDYGQALEAWHFDVNNTGLLKLSSELPVHIESLDPQRFPDMNIIFMNMLHLGDDNVTQHKGSSMTKSYVVSADLDEERDQLEVNINYKQNVKEQNKMQCHIQVPVKYDIDLKCQGSADSSVKNLESETVTITTEHGDCFLNNMKNSRVFVSTEGGDIKSKSLVQGNINMTTKLEGKIETGRLQGQTIKCVTDSGNMKIKAIYSEHCDISTTSGNLHLVNCHGTTELKSDNGNVHIGTMDGDLQACVKQGDVSLFIAREGNHNISSDTGNIVLKLPTLNSKCDLTGKRVSLGDVEVHNVEQTQEHDLVNIKGCLSDSSDNDSNLVITTQNGRVELQAHSWLSSLNLNNTEDSD